MSGADEILGKTSIRNPMKAFIWGTTFLALSTLGIATGSKDIGAIIRRLDQDVCEYLVRHVSVEPTESVQPSEIPKLADTAKHALVGRSIESLKGIDSVEFKKITRVDYCGFHDVERKIVTWEIGRTDEGVRIVVFLRMKISDSGLVTNVSLSRSLN